MTSDGELVAKDVVAGLNAAAFDGAGQATFRYHAMPTLKLTELARTLATVRELSEDKTRVARKWYQIDYAIEVCIRRQILSDKAATISQIKGLAQQVRERFDTHRLPTRKERFIRVDDLKILDDQSIAEELVLKGVSVLIFRGYKEIA